MLRYLLISLIFMSCAASIPAQQKNETPVWQDKAVTAGSAYEPTMTCYLPETPNGITVMICPGGGYDHLAITHEGHDLAPWFNAQGITYIVLKYRLPKDGVNYPLIDAQQAMIVVREHAKEWEIDKNKVGIMGCSAGGHLASLLATSCETEAMRPNFQILLYPVITMQANLTNSGTRNKLIGTNPTEEQIQKYSTDKRVNAQTPQAFLTLSSDDYGVRPANSLLYFESLLRYRIPVAMHIYPTGGHGWGFKDSFKYKSEWTAELQRWLKDGIVWK